MNRYPLLSLDYSNQTPTLAIASSEGRIEERATSAHALENLIPSLQTLLSNTSLQLDDLQCFVVGSGPGSFTGLRCCYSTLKALYLIHGKPIVTAPNDEVRAIAWRKTHPHVSAITVVTSVGRTQAVVGEHLLNSGIISRRVVQKVNDLKTPVLLNQPEVLGLREDNRTVFHYAGSAADLARYFRATRGITIASSSEEIAELQPDYYGDRFRAVQN